MECKARERLEVECRTRRGLSLDLVSSVLRPLGAPGCFDFPLTEILTHLNVESPMKINEDFFKGSEIRAELGKPFLLPEKFLGDQRFSYGQLLTLTFQVPPKVSLLPVQLRLEGAGLALTLGHSNISGAPRAGHQGKVELSFL